VVWSEVQGVGLPKKLQGWLERGSSSRGGRSSSSKKRNTSRRFGADGVGEKSGKVRGEKDDGERWRGDRGSEEEKGRYLRLLKRRIV